MSILKQKAYIIITAICILLTIGCSSNNCPLDNCVTCNYHFYDSEGTPVSLGDTLTVKTLLPGYKTEYSYRMLGYTTVTRSERDSALIKAGFTETVRQVRRDTVLVNRLTKASSFKVPMSYFGKEDTLVFSYAGISLPDTVKIRHSSYAHVELPECGSHRFHSLEGVTATDRYIDHIEISNSKVNYDGNENIRIYLNGIAE